MQPLVGAYALDDAKARPISRRQVAPGGPDALKRGDAVEDGRLLQAKLLIGEGREQIVRGPAAVAVWPDASAPQRSLQAVFAEHGASQQLSRVFTKSRFAGPG